MPKHKSFHWWTEEEIEFLRKNRPTMHYPELKELFFKTFGFEVTERALEYKCVACKIHYQNNGRFQKGHIPKNKGKHISDEQKAKISATMFKKGIKPANCKPMGSTRYCDGYLKIKTEKGWVYYHTLVWEERYGDIPKGYMIRHLDGNPANHDIDNLYLISKSANAIFNKHFKITNDAKLNKTMFMRAELWNKISKLEKGAKDAKESDSKEDSSC